MKFEIRKATVSIGTCPICGTKESSLVPCSSLTDKFESLLEAYVVTEDATLGRKISDLLQDDWGLFSSDRAAESIVLAVLGESANQLFVPRVSDGDAALKRWENLRSELKTKNRFFPQSAPDSGELEFLCSLLSVNEDGVNKTVFRARILKFEGTLQPNDLKAPPPEFASNGRANPVGIPYLYVASDEDTAIAEVRPSAGDVVYLAEFSVERSFNIVDLTDPKKRICPFDVEPDQLPYVRNSMRFLRALGDELSSPALPHRSQIDYLASQYLCEMIKGFGYDGVAYKSSAGPGINYAFFDTELLEVGGQLKKYSIDRVNVDKTLSTD